MEKPGPWQNDVFATSLHSAQIMIGTQQREKLEALRNAAVNPPLQIGLDETMQQIFLNILDSFTTLHLRVPGFLADPSTVLEDKVVRLDSIDSSPHVLEQSMPELSGHRSL
jgi:hypothetical protein